MFGIAFYVVWNRSKGQSKVVHDTRDEAITEAERLSQQHPGQAFFVLKSLRKVTTAPPVLPAPEIQELL